MTNTSGQIEPRDFLDRFERRVLTDAGAPGMDGRAGMGSTTEISQASIASVIYAQAKYLDDNQLNDIIRWLTMYKSS